MADEGSPVNVVPVKVSIQARHGGDGKYGHVGRPIEVEQVGENP